MESIARSLTCQIRQCDLDAITGSASQSLPWSIIAPDPIQSPGAGRKMDSEHLGYGRAYRVIRTIPDIAVLPDPSLG